MYRVYNNSNRITILSRYYSSGTGSSASSGSSYTSANNNRNRNIIKNLSEYRTINKTYKQQQDTTQDDKKKNDLTKLSWDNVVIHRDLTEEKLQMLREEENRLMEYNKKRRKEREIRNVLRGDKRLSSLLKDKNGKVNEDEDEAYNDEDQDDYVDEKGMIDFDKVKTRTFIQESYEYMPMNKKKDQEYIKKEMNRHEDFEKDLSREKGWREWDPDKEEFEQYDQEEEENKKLKKKGLERKEGKLYANNVGIPQEYEHLFLDPEGKNRRITRQEKNIAKKKAELEADKEKNKNVEELKMKSNKPKRKMVYDDDAQEEYTVVQKRMSDRIREILNESFIFQDKNEFLHRSLSDKSDKSSSYGYFKNHQEDVYVEEDELYDPILSRVDLEFTKTTMSPDLRWVQVYWKRNIEQDLNVKVESNQNEEVAKENRKKVLEGIQLTDQKDDLKQLEGNKELNKRIDEKLFGITNILEDLKVENDKGEEEEEEDEYDDEDDEDFEMEEMEGMKKKRISKKKLLEQQEKNYLEIGQSEIPTILDSLETDKAKDFILRNLNNYLPNEGINSSSDVNSDNAVVQKVTKQRRTNMKKIQPEFSFGGYGSQLVSEKVNLQVTIPTIDDISRSATPTKKSNEYIPVPRTKANQYEHITNDQIQGRLSKFIPQLRALIAKNLRTKFVPNINFINDKNANALETSMDIFENIVEPEMFEAAKDSKLYKPKPSQQQQQQIEKKKVIAIGSNEAPATSTKSAITAKMGEKKRLKPKELNFIKLTGGLPKSKRVEYVNKDGQDLRMEKEMVDTILFDNYDSFRDRDDMERDLKAEKDKEEEEREEEDEEDEEYEDDEDEMEFDQEDDEDGEEMEEDIKPTKKADVKQLFKDFNKNRFN